MELAGLEEQKAQAEDALDAASQKAQDAEVRLKALTPQLKDVEGFVEKYLGNPEKLLPKAGTLEYASHYRTKKAMPLVEKLKALALSLYQKLKALRRDFQALQSKFETVSRDREIYKRRWETARDENAGLKSELQEYDLVKRELGTVRIQNVIAASKAREAAEKAARQEAKRHAHSRPGPNS